MTEILDSLGNTIRVGARVLDPEGGGTVTDITEPDGDLDEYGRMYGIPPRVRVAYDDGSVLWHDATWNATGPWDDDREDYTCDDLTVAVDRREPDGYRMEAGRIVPTDR